MRYACPQNAHLRRVNSAFSGFAILKIPLVIQLLVGATVQHLLDSRSFVLICSARFLRVALVLNRLLQ